MTERNSNCRGSLSCKGECPPNAVECPFDKETPLSKDRDSSRMRHHNEARAKKNAEKTLEHVTSRACRLSDNATLKERSRAEQKCKNTDKKVRHLKSKN